MRRKLLWRPQHLITLAGGSWLFFSRFKRRDDVSVSLPLLGPEFFPDRLLRKPQKIGLESQTNRCPADVSGIGPPSGVGPRRSPLLPRAGPVATQAFACLHYRSSIAIRCLDSHHDPLPSQLLIAVPSASLERGIHSVQTFSSALQLCSGRLVSLRVGWSSVRLTSAACAGAIQSLMWRAGKPDVAGRRARAARSGPGHVCATSPEGARRRRLRGFC